MSFGFLSEFFHLQFNMFKINFKNQTFANLGLKLYLEPLEIDSIGGK